MHKKQAGDDTDYIVISSDEYPPFRVDTTILFLTELASRGHRFNWYMQSGTECERRYQVECNGNTLWIGRTDTGGTRFARLRKHLVGLRDQIEFLWDQRHSDCGFVLVKNKYLISLAALLYARIKGIGFVFWLSYPHVEEGLFKVKQGTARYPIFYWIRGHALSFLLYKFIMPRATHVFAQSAQMKQDVCQQGVDGKKITPVPMGVSVEEFDGYLSDIKESEEGIDPAGNLDIVYVGTLQSARKMDFLVRVLEKVRREEPQATLTLVGDGDGPEDRKIIESEVERLGLNDYVKITGFLDRRSAMEYVTHAAVCVSPFYPDPILLSTSPTKLVEYWAMGKAVVANDHPEQKITIQESGGGFCVPYEEEAFAEAIVHFLRDPTLAARFGQLGRAYVEKSRDYSQIANDVEPIILERCGMSKRRSRMDE